MKYIIIFLISILTLSCSGDVEKNQAPEQKTLPVESKPVNPLKPKANPVEEHISGGGQAHVSGAPSSSHISGQ